MSVTPEHCTKNAIHEIKETFEGFDERAIEEVSNIVLKHVTSFYKSVRREALAAAAQASDEQEPEKPPLKRLTNYTLFGIDFRKSHPDLTADMIKE